MLREARTRTALVPAFFVLERHVAAAGAGDANLAVLGGRHPIPWRRPWAAPTPAAMTAAEPPLVRVSAFQRTSTLRNSGASTRAKTSPTTCFPSCCAPPRSAPWTCWPTGPGWRGRTCPGSWTFPASSGHPSSPPSLERLGLATGFQLDARRLALTDRGLKLLARRDRVSTGEARQRWSAGADGDGDNGADSNRPSVSGRRSRQLLRDLEHTAAVHRFVAALNRQAHSLGWDVEQLDPPHRASRYFRHYGRPRALHPDAFGTLRQGDLLRLFFLEYERRAVRPATMAQRLAPYLRYYSSHRPADDHGHRPLVLVVFDDPVAPAHFLEVARREMLRVRVPLPLLASHRELLERQGPLGRAWLAPGGDFQPGYAFLP